MIGWKIFLLLLGLGAILLLSGLPLIALGILLLFRVFLNPKETHRFHVWMGWATLATLLAVICSSPVPYVQILRAGVSLLWIETVLSWMAPEERFLLIDRLPYPLNGVIWIILRESSLLLERLRWTWRAWRLAAHRPSPQMHARALVRLMDLLEARTNSLAHALKLRGRSWFR